MTNETKRNEWDPTHRGDGYEIHERGDVVAVELWYPRVNTARAQRVEVGLVDVRAADNIRVSYDFYRDGWKIEQASVFEWEADDGVFDEGWAEVAFVQAWGSQRVPPKESGE